MAGDATPPSSPPPPAPELPPGLVAEYLESARSQLGVLAGLAERLLLAARGPQMVDAPRRENHKKHRGARPVRVNGRVPPPAGRGGGPKRIGCPAPRRGM